MQQIAEGVFIETAYAGVTLGVIVQPQGLVLVDAPLRLDDARAWRAAHVPLCANGERLLVNLDAHYDRTLGTRAMEQTVVAHDNVVQSFRNRPTTFKGQPGNTGAEWEQHSGLGNVRWSAPEIGFSNRMDIDWGRSRVSLMHRPGHAPGAIWAILPDEKTIFAGDSLLPYQPPFLSQADLPIWIAALEELLTPEYAGYTLVSGRCGLVDLDAVRWQIAYLRQICNHLDEMALAHAPDEETLGLLPGLMEEFKAEPARRDQYTQRLRWGLPRYYARHYQAAAAGDDE